MLRKLPGRVITSEEAFSHAALALLMLTRPPSLSKSSKDWLSCDTR